MTMPLTITFAAATPKLAQHLASMTTDDLRDAGYVVRPAPTGEMNGLQFLCDLGQHIVEHQAWYTTIITSVATLATLATKNKPTPAQRIEVVVTQGPRMGTLSGTTDADAALLKDLILSPDEPVQVTVRATES